MKLPIINEKGNTIGSEERSVVHEKGLLHPEIAILIRLSNGKFVFQKRSMTKDTDPGKLTFAVSGHIDLNQTPEEAVIRELEEETGIKESIDNLNFFSTCINNFFDDVTQTTDHNLIYFYGYDFNGTIENLRIEPEDGAGFVEYSFEEINNFDAKERDKFKKIVFTPEVLKMFEKFNLTRK